MDKTLLQVVRSFRIDGEIVSIEAYGCGHINDTFLVVTAGGPRFILQRINRNLFPNADKLMNNIKLVTEFVRQSIVKRGGDPERETLNLVSTREGDPFLKAEDGNYRVYKFLERTVSFQIVEKPEHFYESAVAFGNFAMLLGDFDAAQLYEILPDFHNTRVRFENFKKALQKDASRRAHTVSKEIEFILSREKYVGKLADMLSSGKMPLRVTHNDTKLNNVLFDDTTKKAIAVIDLDTIMPGSVCYDFGDSIRFGCNPAAEDERDLSKVNFRLDLFNEYAKGYLGAFKGVTKEEKDHLAFGSMLMTFECGMRFLSDYLDGDLYFKTHRDGQNLDRARTQFKLVSDMETLLDKMNEIVHAL